MATFLHRCFRGREAGRGLARRAGVGKKAPRCEKLAVELAQAGAGRTLGRRLPLLAELGQVDRG